MALFCVNSSILNAWQGFEYACLSTDIISFSTETWFEFETMFAKRMCASVMQATGETPRLISYAMLSLMFRHIFRLIYKYRRFFQKL